jgi:hypothetical protein
MITITAYTRHIRRLIRIAEIPNVMIISLKKGTGTTLSVTGVMVFLASSLPMKTKSRKQQLQMTVMREKNEITFI